MKILHGAALIGAIILIPACTRQTDGMPTTAAPAGATAQNMAGHSTEGRDCFWPSQVTGFENAGRDRILVATGVREYYLFKTFGSCPDLDFTQKLALKTRSTGMVCTGLDVDLIVPTTIGPRRCPVQMIRKLTEAEVTAHRKGGALPES